MLLVFSFLNVTMFTDYANAEGDNGEATEFAEPVGEPEAQAQPEDEANGPESEEPAEEVNEAEPAAEPEAPAVAEEPDRRGGRWSDCRHGGSRGSAPGQQLHEGGDGVIARCREDSRGGRG